jgi:tetratricopeptide (TPR) repeat protein
MRNYDRAIELLEPMFQKGTLSDEGMFTLFSLYLNLDRNEQALDVAQHMIAKDPDDVRGYLALGAVYERQDKLADAERAYRRGLKVEPDQTALFDAIARLKRQGRKEIAILTRGAPGDPAALMRIAQIYDDARTARARPPRSSGGGRHPEVAAAQFGSVSTTTRPTATTTVERFRRCSRAATAMRPDDTRYQNEVKYFVGMVGPVAATKRSSSSSRSPSSLLSRMRAMMARIYEPRPRDHRGEVRGRARQESRGLSRGLYQKKGDLPGAVGLMQDLIAQNPGRRPLLRPGVTTASPTDASGR